MSAEYKIRSVSDFLNLPPERLSACLKDFTVFLAMAREQPRFDGIVQDALQLPSGSLRLRCDVFHWVDDGKPGLSGLNFESEDGATLGRVEF